MQESASWLFPLCESYLLINQFVESRSQFKTGLVNHAFSAALRALLLVGFLCCKLFAELLLDIREFSFCFFAHKWIIFCSLQNLVSTLFIWLLLILETENVMLDLGVIFNL